MRTAPGRRAKPNGSPAWRDAPATTEQLAVLRKIAQETGRSFDPDRITKGEASDRISRRFATNPRAARAHAKAERKRRRLDRRLVNPAASWRFGDSQTPEQEQAEIRRARRDGLEDVYMKLQAWVNARRPADDQSRPA